MQNIFIANAVTTWLDKKFHQMMLTIDGAIYWAVSQVYQIFIKLASARIFEDSFFSNFARRIYAILGVFMLFYLAYALLNAIIDPDKAMSGDKGIPNIAKNVVISLVMLGLMPTLFDYAYKIQGIIFKENVIGAVIFGIGGVNEENDNVIESYGNYMAYSALNAFLNPANYNVSLANNYSWFDLKAELLEDGNFLKISIMGDWAIKPQPLIGSAPADDGTPAGTSVELTYTIFISSICGGVLLYIMASFCLDLGVRVIKFTFCQLIAPIPVVMRVVPNKKGSFDKWLKLTTTVYFEVFIRVAIMYMVIYFFSELANVPTFKYCYQDSNGTTIINGIQARVVLAIILMGLLTFAKQAPGIIGDILGLDSKNMKLGIKDKLKAGGFFTAGAAGGAALAGAGAGITSFVQNGISRGRNAYKNIKEASTPIEKAKEFGKGVFSTAASASAGFVSASIRGTKEGLSAKNFGDIKKAASKGATISAENRDKREFYKATHGNTIKGSVIGHIKDAGTTVKEWAGVGINLEQLQARQADVAAVIDARKAVNDRLKYIRDNIEDGDRIVTFKYKDHNGTEYESTQKLAILRNELQVAQNAGASANQIYDIKKMIDAAEKQANKDILSGLKPDINPRTGTHDKVDVKDYDGDLVAKVTKLMTTTRKAESALNANVSVNTTSLESAIQKSADNYNKDIAQEVIGGRFNPNELLADINKPATEAKSKIDQAINTYYDQQNNKGK